MIETENPVKNAVLIKGSLFALTVLQLLETDPNHLQQHLAQLAKQFPHFFQHTPIVIDLQKVGTAPIDFSALISAITQLQMIPIAVRHADPKQQLQAIQAGLAIMPDDTPREKSTTIDNTATAPHQPLTQTANAKTTVSPTRVISQPVRSGQQIYAQGGDLLVMASVSHGAELLADGHIHVYGPLRGRALAGIQGDKEARIFCRSLDAELISIAGVYQVKEHLRVPASAGMIQISLQDEELKIQVM